MSFAAYAALLADLLGASKPVAGVIVMIAIVIDCAVLVGNWIYTKIAATA